jgi:hypothetical protein
MQQSRARKIAAAPAKPAKAAKEGSRFSNCSGFSGGVSEILLCSVCGLRLRLGTLNRCRQCIAVVAEQDRDARAAAETRVAARKTLEVASRPAGESPAGNSPLAAPQPARHGLNLGPAHPITTLRQWPTKS